MTVYIHTIDKEEEIKERYNENEIEDLTPMNKTRKIYGVMIAPFVYLHVGRYGIPKKPYRVIIKVDTFGRSNYTLPFNVYKNEVKRAEEHGRIYMSKIKI